MNALAPAKRESAISNERNPLGIATRLLHWFDQHGRHDLPWQHPRDPYRVWLSEVMLQQTQVASVIPYFNRFVDALPDARALAAATMDQVLALWSGLGYYSRAHNLQRAAILCVERHHGTLPRTLAELTALPGIGRSTAGAILSLAFDTRAPILDGNARRVLIRHRGIEGDPLSPVVQSRLWKLSEAWLPDERIADYTQAIMDLGATVCVRASPRCTACPLSKDCIAFVSGRTGELPQPRRRPPRRRRQCHALIARDGAGRVLLERRPVTGIWGGLWSLPEFPDRDSLAAACASSLAVGEPDPVPTRPAAFAMPADPSHAPEVLRDLGVVHHAFTHFELALYPVLIDTHAFGIFVREPGASRWFDRADLASTGLPAPIRTLLASLPEQTHDK